MSSRVVHGLATVAWAFGTACNGASTSSSSADTGDASGLEAGMGGRTDRDGAQSGDEREVADANAGGVAADVATAEAAADVAPTEAGTSGADSGAMGVYCASATPPAHCQVGEICCFVYLKNPQTASCLASGSPCSSSITCAKKADCASGQLCCGIEQNSNYTQVSCQTSCPLGSDHVHQQFCDPNGTDCASGLTCVPSNILPGYSICQ